MIPTESDILGAVYHETFADRVRSIVGLRPYVVEEQMAEGTAFLVDGRVACCVTPDGALLVRTTAARTHLHDVLTGPVSAWRPDGVEAGTWLRVAPEGVVDDAELRGWVAIGLAVATSVPPVRYRPTSRCS